MSCQDKHEPPYPQNQQECDGYCDRLVNSLSNKLQRRLVCVLLSGSWATGEAKPNQSDIDLTIVVDFVDDPLLNSLCDAWKEAEVGYANVYGLDEIGAMSHQAFHMYTTNAIVLFGTNPFPQPSRSDFAADLAATAEIVARMARNIEYAYWLTEDEIKDNLSYLLGKNCLRRALQNLVAFRTGKYPRSALEHKDLLKGYREYEFVIWLESLSESDKILHHRKIARKLSLYAREWFKGIIN